MQLVNIVKYISKYMQLALIDTQIFHTKFHVQKWADVCVHTSLLPLAGISAHIKFRGASHMHNSKHLCNIWCSEISISSMNYSENTVLHSLYTHNWKISQAVMAIKACTLECSV